MKKTISIFAVLIISLVLLGAGCEAPIKQPPKTNTSSDAELVWPQSFNSLIIGSSVNISWRIHNPALTNTPVHLNLLKEDGTFAETIGFVSSAHVLHYKWTVKLSGNNQPGKYKIQMVTDDGFSTFSETFTVVQPAS